MIIDSGVVTGSLTSQGSMVVTGSVTATTGFSGSLFGSASFAITASYWSGSIGLANTASNAQTASSADNFTVRGTLTAQTIIVQTLTSSISYLTGSTRHGSSLTDTHQFTGSVGITGSLSVTPGVVNSLTASYAITASYVTGLSPTASYASTVAGGTTNYIPLWSANTTLSSSIMYQSASRIGISTLSPATTLAIAGSTSTVFGLSLEPSGWNTARHRFIVPTSGDTSMWSFNYNGSAIDTSSYAPSAITVGQGIIAFYTTGSGNVPAERMRINGSGNVGIGTTSPSVTLHTVGDGLFYNTSNANVTINSAAGVATLTLTNAAGSQVIYGGVGGSNNMDFYTNSTFRARIDSSGNVALGTTTADEKLTIQSGNIKLYSVQNVSGQYRYIGTEYSSGNGNNKAEIRFGIDGADTRTKISFHVANGGGTINEALSLGYTGAATFSNSVQGAFFKSTNGVVETVLSYSSTPAGVIGTLTNHPLEIYTNGSVKATFTSTGNLGLGVTPSAWSLGKAIEVGTLGNSFWGVGINSVQLTSNYFYDGSYKYANNGFANRYDIGSSSGIHAWYNAPSDTAGNAITFTQAMTLTNGGNLLVGTTTDSGYKLDVSGSGRFSAGLNTLSGTRNIQMISYAADINYLRSSGANFWFGVSDAADLVFLTNNVNRLTINSIGAATFSSSVTLGTSGNLRLSADSSNGQIIGAFGKGLQFYTNDGNSLPLVLSTSGAATFSSSVTATQFNASSKLTWGTATDGTTGQIATDNTNNYFDYKGNLYFRGATASNTLVTITSAGNVGIGTTSPSSILDIQSAQAVIKLTSTTGTNTVYSLYINTSGNFYVGKDNSTGSAFGVANATILYEGGDNPMVFWTNSQQRMRITSGGNILMGTTTDAGYKLDVVGTSRVSGAATFSSTLTTGGTIVASGQLYLKQDSTNAKQIIISGLTDTNKQLIIGYYTTGNGYSSIQSVYQTVGYTPLLLNPNGGNVGIGTTTIRNNGAGETAMQITGTSYPLLSLNGSSNSVGVNTGINSIGGYIGTYTNHTFTFTTSDTERMRITSGGNVGIGTTTPNAKLDVNGNTLITGSLTVTSTITELSSLRYKEDIQPISFGLDKVLQMRGVSYIKKDTQLKEIGVIAEEINKILPDIVHKSSDGQVESVSYSRITAVLIEAIKELKAEIDILKNK